MKKQVLVLNILLCSILYPYSLYGQHEKVDEIMMFGTRINAPVVMDVQKSDDKVYFNAINKSFFPYDFEIEFQNFQNLTPRIFKHNTILHSGINKLFTLTISNKEESILYNYTFKYSMSAPNNIDLSFPYIIPLGSGKRVRLDSVNTGGTILMFANRFKMTVKDTVFSIRKGIITALPVGNTDSERIIKSSSLEVLHADGTIAIYIGLDPSSVLLTVGQVIYPRQPIGFIDGNNMLRLYLLALTGDGKVKNVDFFFTDVDGKNIPSRLINGKTVTFPQIVIKKEMSAKEIKKFDKGSLY